MPRIPLLTVYLVWSREGHAWAGESSPYDDPITYRDWALVVRDVKAALAHGRLVRIHQARIARETWDRYEGPSAAQVRRLRGTP